MYSVSDPLREIAFTPSRECVPDMNVCVRVKYTPAANPITESRDCSSLCISTLTFDLGPILIRREKMSLGLFYKIRTYRDDKSGVPRLIRISIVKRHRYARREIFGARATQARNIFAHPRNFRGLIGPLPERFRHGVAVRGG